MNDIEKRKRLSSVSGASSSALTGLPRGGNRGSFTGRGSVTAPGKRNSTIVDFSSAFYSKLSAAIDSKQEDEDSAMNNFKINVKTFLAYSQMGKIYEFAFLSASIGSGCLYIYQTYHVQPYTGMELLARGDIPFILEIILCMMFSLDFFMWMILSDQKLDYLFSSPVLIDLCIIVPTWVTIDSHPNNHTLVQDIVGSWDRFLWICFGLKTFRVLRALRLRQKVTDMFENEVQQSIGGMAVFILCMLVFNTSVMQYVEASVQDLDFHSWIYCIWITTATVGYGDISPVTDFGRLAVMLMIAVSIITVPKMTNELLETMASSSVYSRAVYRPKRPNNKHILICGDLRSTSIPEFFSELFHEDHENANLDVVVLTPCAPTHEFKILLRDPFFSTCLEYLEGTPLQERDLDRAGASTAQAIFILTNKFSAYPDEEDAKTILQQFSIKRYIQFVNTEQHILYCLQLIRPENRRHLGSSSGVSKDEDLIVCLNEIKMGIIAKSVVFPGTSTLIMNLLTSITIDGPDVQDDSDSESESESESESVSESGSENCGENSHTGTRSSTSNPDRSKVAAEDNWIEEYKRGCDWEVYTTELSDMFEGGSFAKLAQSMYVRLGVVLFALQVQEVANPSNTRTLLNPANYLIPSKSEYNVHGLVIAQNKTLSDLSYSALKETILKEAGDTQIFSKLQTLSNVHPRRKYSGNLSVTATGGPKDAPSSPLKSPGFGMKGFGLGSLAEGDSNDDHVVKRRVKGQMALMKRFKEIKVSTDSEQEKLHKLEEEYMQTHYYMRTTPANVEDVTISTSVLKEIPHIRRHIIITGKGLSNLFDLIRPLRARDLGPMRYIVILHPNDIPNAVWRLLSHFDGILVVKGSPLEEEDIRRAGIFRAEHVVILADSSTTRISATAGTSAGMEALADADAIFTYKAMRRLNERAMVVVEIVKQSNIGYLDLTRSEHDNGVVYDESDYRFTPQFACGELFTSSLLDTIICQAFYNPQIIAVVNRLISSRDQKEIKAVANTAVHGSMSTVGKTKLDAISGSNLYQMPIPKEFSRKSTYGELFKLLSGKGILMLGLYRGVPAIINRGEKMNVMPYVFTNPPEDTELFPCDSVFVLATKPVQSQNMSMQELMNQQAVVREIHHYETTKQHGIQRDATVFVGKWQNLVHRFEAAMDACDNLAPDLIAKLKTKLADIKFKIEEIGTLPPNVSADLPDNANGSSNSRLNSLLTIETRVIKYQIDVYIPLISSMRGFLVENSMAHWKNLKAAASELYSKAVQDRFNKLQCSILVLRDFVGLGMLMAFPEPVEMVGTNVVLSAAPTNFVGGKASGGGGWGRVMTAANISKSTDNDILDIPQLETMDHDLDVNPTSCNSNSGVDMGSVNHVVSPKPATATVTAAPVLEIDSNEVSQIRKRMITLYGDVLDALEVTIWEGCNSLE